MGKGLFGGGQDASGKDAGGKDSGGGLGETIGKLLQQGLNQSRSLPPAPPSGAAPPAPGDAPAQPDSQPMNDVLRQLFNR